MNRILQVFNRLKTYSLKQYEIDTGGITIEKIQKKSENWGVNENIFREA